MDAHGRRYFNGKEIRVDSILNKYGRYEDWYVDKKSGEKLFPVDWEMMELREKQRKKMAQDAKEYAEAFDEIAYRVEDRRFGDCSNRGCQRNRDGSDNTRHNCGAGFQNSM